MYGLKEAGVIAFEQLAKKLSPAGYEPMPFIDSWRHRTKRTTFVLSCRRFRRQVFSKPPQTPSKPLQGITNSLSIGLVNYTAAHLDWH
jgi:hypothetical protein